MSLPPAYEQIDLNTGGALENPEWIYSVAHSLLSLPVDDAISSFLKFAGEAVDADRAWMICYNRQVTHFVNTHEWCRAGIAPYVEDLQQTPVSMIAWLHEQLVAKRAVMITDIGRLPRTARAIQAEFHRQKNCSVLSVPLFHEDRIFGIVGLDAVTAQRRWNTDIANAFFHCGTLITAALTRFPSGPAAAVMKGADGGKADLVNLHFGSLVQAVPMDRIVAIRAVGDYTRVHLKEGASTLELRPLKTWEALLPRASFQKIHRGTLVNVHAIHAVERPPAGTWSLSVHGLPDVLPVSKSFRAELRSRMGF